MKSEWRHYAITFPSLPYKPLLVEMAALSFRFYQTEMLLFKKSTVWFIPKN
ncbi:hypothetical protein [Pseudoflavitalea rhizosphaerae]|uniref:hypothetical protein n=1 Tax=Pseudoflavitalea rhizosphaerae TaxID=1884793 RepID=UPI0013E02188|nr:hypothetical protein [Pseudoflavitalea rhizosphaerae]